MSVAVFADRLKFAINRAIEANHVQMDKGKDRDEYMKLVGKNAALAEVRDDMIKAAAKDLEEMDDD